MLTGIALSVVVCGFVLAPLFLRRSGETPLQLNNDTTGQENHIREIIRELEFDLETGKLSIQEYQKLLAEQMAALAELYGKQKRTAHKMPGKCRKCGAVPARGDKFCSQCGTAVE